MGNDQFRVTKISYHSNRTKGTTKMKSSIALCFITMIVAACDAQVRKCLEDHDCHSDECCAQSFYLFRCEKRGYRNGDRCGLCGCAYGLNCVSEGLNPFARLSGRGFCRYQDIPEVLSPSKPNKTAALPVPVKPQPQPIKPQPQVVRTTKLPNLKPKPIKPHRDHFYETFQPIYEQFIELAASVAGISLDQLDEETTHPSQNSH